MKNIFDFSKKAEDLLRKNWVYTFYLFSDSFLSGLVKDLVKLNGNAFFSYKSSCSTQWGNSPIYSSGL